MAMFKEFPIAPKILVALLDVAIASGCFLASHRMASLQSQLAGMDQYLTLFYSSSLLLLIFLHLFRLYPPMATMGTAALVLRAAEVVVGSAVMSASFLFLAHATWFSRRLFLTYFALLFPVLLIERLLLRWWERRLLSRGIGVRNVLIVGGGEKLSRLLQWFRQQPYGRFTVAEVLNCSDKVLEVLEEKLKAGGVDEVHFAYSRSFASSCPIGSALRLVEDYGRTSRVFINLDEEIRSSRIDLFRFGDLNGLIVYSALFDPDMMLLKRMMDLGIAVVGLCITALLFPFIAILIKLDSPGPVIYSQERIGLNGRRFKMYKFRTMVEGADALKPRLMEQNVMEGAVFKVPGDPRVTTVGRWLRITSLDELPQFWNVLKGEMSVVGTRPPTPDEVERYKAWHYRRIAIRPGITGLWQVSGRNKIRDFNEIVNLDLKYIYHWTPFLDVKIILKTCWLLLRPSKAGAC